jgi:hypothetical protein
MRRMATDFIFDGIPFTFSSLWWLLVFCPDTINPPILQFSRIIRALSRLAHRAFSFSIGGSRSFCPAFRDIDRLLLFPGVLSLLRALSTFHIPSGK